MNVRWEDPAWWWAALVVGIAMIVGARWFAAMHMSRRIASVVLRLGLVAVLSSMLAGLCVVHRNDTYAVIAVVDASGSVRRYFRDAAGRGAEESVRAFLSESGRARGPDDLLGVVIFGEEARTFAAPSRAGVPGVEFRGVRADGTRISDALDLARAMIPPDASGRIVLFSDGVPTGGDVRSTSLRAGPAGRPVPLDVVPMEYVLGREVIAESLDAPSTAAAQSAVTLRLSLSSTSDATGRVRLLHEGRGIGVKESPSDGHVPVRLRPGLNVVTLTAVLPAGRVHRFAAEFEPDVEPDGRGGTASPGDGIAENNRAETVIFSPGQGAVLFATTEERSGDGSGRALSDVLREGGSEVSVVAPEEVPSDLLLLQAYDLVILENVPASSLTREKQTSLAAYVTEMGGGLIMIGGPLAFGAGGWQDTPIARILPVELDIPDVVIAPEAATVFVLDNSGSMWHMVLGTGRTQQEIANDAAAVAVRSLARSDLVGVITFNSDADVLVPLARNTDPASTVDALRSISPGGGTNMAPGLALARDELRRAAGQAKVKHVVVLTDGVSRSKNRLTDLTRELAADGVKVSAIAVGDQADLTILRAMAEAGGGAFYHAVNATQLPKVLLSAVRIVRTPLIREEAFVPGLSAGDSPVTAGLSVLPELGGLVLTRPRAEPTVVTPIVSPSGDPLLAHWNAGLGRVAAWTSDASHWAAAWLGTPVYRTLWSQIATYASRPPASSDLAAACEISDGRLLIRLEGVKAGSDMLASATVLSPRGGATECVLTPRGPGVHEGSVPAPDPGAYVVVVKPTSRAARYAPLVVGAAAVSSLEFRSESSDRSLLEDLARATGGRVLDINMPSRQPLFDRAGFVPRDVQTPITAVLLAWALALLLADIAVRRLAWDRWLARRFGAGYADRGRRTGEEPLRATSQLLRAKPAMNPEPALALGADDARNLALAARDRRRRLKLSTEPAASKENREGDDVPSSEALRAAKKRAHDRFDEHEG